MASASSSSARNLFHDSKRRLADRVAGTVNNVASVGRQIVRGSKSNEVCPHSFSFKLFVRHDLLFVNDTIFIYAIQFSIRFYCKRRKTLHNRKIRWRIRIKI